MTSVVQPPASNSRTEWQRYWKSIGQDWRWEPEIDKVRQATLTKLRGTATDIDHYRFPFMDERLSRADIEWLLASHEDRGPIQWANMNERERIGLDLSGAILSRVDLRGLPLARLRGGVGGIYNATDEQREAAAIRLDGANLMEARLQGADLRYAHLERVNLSGAYLEGADLSFAHLERAQLVGAHLEGVNLSGAELYRANLGGAYLEGADLSKANLRQADFQKAHLEDASLRDADCTQAIMIETHLERVDLSNAIASGALLSQANLKRAIITEAHLEGAILSEAHLGRANLWRAHMPGAVLHGAELDNANLEETCLDGAVLSEAHLHGASLRRAMLRGADLREAHLEGADLREAHLEGIILWVTDTSGHQLPPTTLDTHGNEYWSPDSFKKLTKNENLDRVQRSVDYFPAVLQPADLRCAFLDSATRLNGIILGDPLLGCIRAADIHWNGANLSVIDWKIVRKSGLGDQRIAKQRRKSNGRLKTSAERLADYDAAIRANRQLAIALLEEGLDEVAINFTAHIQALEEVALWWRGDYGELAASVLLNRVADLLAGYGYKPLRSIVSYLTVISGFCLAYWLLGPLEGYHYSIWGWLVLSITSFHGRGFFPAPLDLESTITQLEAAEAVVGLFVEVSLIAIYTRRFFYTR